MAPRKRIIRIVRMTVALVAGFILGILVTLIFASLSGSSLASTIRHWVAGVTSDRVGGLFGLLLVTACLPVAAFFAGFFGALIARSKELIVAIIVGTALALSDVAMFIHVNSSLSTEVGFHWLQPLGWLLCVVLAGVGGYLARAIRLRHSKACHGV